MIPPSDHNPFVDPAWRHRRAARLVAQGRKANHPRDDDASRQAWRFYRLMHRCTDDLRRLALWREMPALCEAHDFFTTSDLYQRAELEARFLARQDDEAIAAKCGLSPAAVAAYHDVYFCVRPNLQAEGYIFNVVIGDGIYRGLNENDRDLIVKLVGYQMGAAALDDLLDYYAHPLQLTVELSGLTTDEIKVFCRQVRLQLLVLTLTMPADERCLRLMPVVEDLLSQLRVAEAGLPETQTALRLQADAVARCVQEWAKSQAAERRTDDAPPVISAGDAPNVVACEADAQEEIHAASAASVKFDAVTNPGPNPPRTLVGSSRPRRQGAAVAVAG